MITINEYTTVSKKRLDEIQFMAQLILDDLCLPEITINIEPVSTMRQFGADGTCCSSRSIDIVNKRSQKDLFKVIAHEMRHAYQYLHGIIDKDNTKLMEECAVEYENFTYKYQFKNIQGE